MSRAQEMRGAAETRLAESRKAETRRAEQKVGYRMYQPGSQFELKIPGKRVRWVAEFVRGERVANAIEDRLREGYRPVRQSEIDDPFYKEAAEIMGVQQSDGFVRSGGLIAMALDEDWAQERDRLVQAKVDELDTAANLLHGLQSAKKSSGSLPTSIEANDVTVFTGAETVPQ